jgi:Phage integrase, N-terminal SAM-like domain
MTMGTLRKRGKKWYLRYYRKGHSYEVAAHTDSKQDAQDMLDRRVGAVKSGKRLSPKMDRLKFDEAAADLLNDYRINDRRSFAVAERRIRLHLEPYFGGWRMADITTADIRECIVRRQGETEIVRGAYDMTLTDGTVKRIAESRRNVARISNAEINRELALLRRMFSLRSRNRS